MKGNKGLGSTKDYRLSKVIRDIAAKHNVSVDLVNKVVISQFKFARVCVDKGWNIRFFKLFMLYNYKNKNPDYLDMKEKERELNKQN